MKNIFLAAYLILNLVFISNIGFFNFCNVAKASKMSSAEAKSNARALGGSLSSKVQGFASTSVESNEAMKKGDIVLAISPFLFYVEGTKSLLF